MTILTPQSEPEHEMIIRGAMPQDHLPELNIALESLAPFLRRVVEVGGGTFRCAPMSGYPHGIPVLTGNTLYPFTLYLTESPVGLAPARKNERAEWVPVLSMKDCWDHLPMFARAFQAAIENRPAKVA